MWRLIGRRRRRGPLMQCFFLFFSHILRRLSVHLAVGYKIASTTGLWVNIFAALEWEREREKGWEKRRERKTERDTARVRKREGERQTFQDPVKHNKLHFAYSVAIPLFLRSQDPLGFVIPRETRIIDRLLLAALSIEWDLKVWLVDISILSSE